VGRISSACDWCLKSTALFGIKILTSDVLGKFQILSSPDNEYLINIMTISSILTYTKEFGDGNRRENGN
jgi:hypothetical protein